MRSFCLKQGRGLRASAAHLYTNFLWAPLPIPHPPAGFLALHAYVRSTRSSSRVLQIKVILLTIRWEVLYVQTWQRQLPLKEYGCSHLWQTLVVLYKKMRVFWEIVRKFFLLVFTSSMIYFSSSIIFLSVFNWYREKNCNFLNTVAWLSW